MHASLVISIVLSLNFVSIPFIIILDVYGMF